MAKQIKGTTRPVAQWASALSKKRTPVSSTSDQVKYQVFGDGISRATWIFFHPNQLDDKVAKYKEKNQWLFGPLSEVSEYNVN